MQLKMIAVRLPESQHRYLKHKASLSGINLQSLMAKIIDDHQKNDVEYKAAINQILSDLNEPQGVDNGV